MATGLSRGACASLRTTAARASECQRGARGAALEGYESPVERFAQAAESSRGVVAGCDLRLAADDEGVAMACQGVFYARRERRTRPGVPILAARAAAGGKLLDAPVPRHVALRANGGEGDGRDVAHCLSLVASAPAIQSGLSRYQRTVRSMPSSNCSVGSQPSSACSLRESMA